MRTITVGCRCCFCCCCTVFLLPTHDFENCEINFDDDDDDDDSCDDDSDGDEEEEKEEEASFAHDMLNAGAKAKAREKFSQYAKKREISLYPMLL